MFMIVGCLYRQILKKHARIIISNLMCKNHIYTQFVQNQFIYRCN